MQVHKNHLPLQLKTETNNNVAFFIIFNIVIFIIIIIAVVIIIIFILTNLFTYLFIYLLLYFHHGICRILTNISEIGISNTDVCAYAYIGHLYRFWSAV